MLKAVRLLMVLGVAIAVGVPSRSQAQDFSGSGKAVFVMTNDATQNAVMAYPRNSDGSLGHGHKFLTGGRGSGGTVDPLASQGSLKLSDDGSLLFAVNAGSGDLSVFRVFGNFLWLADVVPCGGSEPVAVAQYRDLVYLVNAGGTNNVVGFRLTRDQKLKRIPHASYLLSTGNTGPGSITFSPYGQLLLVTEKATNKIDSFSVRADGTLGPIVTTPSAGPGAFAVQFAPNGTALVVETGPAGGTNASAISSYAAYTGGALSVISPSVATQGAATCWLQVTPNGYFVYTANSGTSTISGFSIGANGSLTPLPGTIVGTLPGGSTDLDVTVSSNGKFLYTLNTGAGTIGIFGIQKDGTLVSLGTVEGLPVKSGLNGIAAN
ncbi:MAG TPA: beta-propeller fold lactonase family protein [Terriglobales bacterium]|nr:beta-propeller fold lactonase family protein [Terriglobales bacterium]